MSKLKILLLNCCQYPDILSTTPIKMKTWNMCNKKAEYVFWQKKNCSMLGVQPVCLAEAYTVNLGPLHTVLGVSRTSSPLHTSNLLKIAE